MKHMTRRISTDISARAFMLSTRAKEESAPSERIPKKMPRLKSASAFRGRSWLRVRFTERLEPKAKYRMDLLGLYVADFERRGAEPNMKSVIFPLEYASMR
jgi:hypothetical protein